MKKIRACAIIIKEDQVILLWRKINNNSYFVFPGGGKESNETLEEAVIREAFEETSIKVKIDRFLYKLIDENSEHNFYLCSYISGEPKLGTYNEHLETSENNQYKPMWKGIDEMSNLPILPLEVRDWFIKDYKNNFAGVPREETILINDRRKL
ncbi:MAG: NUDIX domain-containing protein [Candidatus Paceibacterota bacterium]|jgi:ADP-ribose pyrophosphatase YjhB (NUDIX family)